MILKIFGAKHKILEQNFYFKLILTFHWKTVKAINLKIKFIALFRSAS